MRFFEAFAVLLALSAASAAVVDIHPLSDVNIDMINQKAKTWKAGKNFDVEDWEKVKKISSGALPSIQAKNTNLKVNPHNEDETVPESFDSRDAWPTCDSIKQIRDQSNCGSCWAFAAVESMSDRICIQSTGKVQVYVSAEDLLACCKDCGFGCGGGYLPEAWAFWQENGIVTGGLYNSSQGCQDYSLEPCEHLGNKGKRPQCSSLVVDTPQCTNECYDESLEYEASTTWGQDVHLFNTEKQIQMEIYKNGPVETAFTVFDDFPTYKSGIYQATSNASIGRHAIKILGWGVEEGVKYWLCANSWNEDWGDHGFFKFLRGENHCDMETQAVASNPKL